MSTTRDEVFASNQKIQDFIFDDSIAEVFDDMLERSVPYYTEIQRMVVELAVSYLEGSDPACLYDIGCSTGNTLLGVAAALDPASDVTLVGLEPSPAMCEQASKRLREIAAPREIEIRQDEIQNVGELTDAQVITMLFTLQFVRPPVRPQVVQMCFDSLKPGGCLIMAEKILAEDGDVRRRFIDLYHDYKLRSGYTSTEILRKREALENVLVPFTSTENLELLRKSGFAVTEQCFQWYNFAVYLAVKS